MISKIIANLIKPGMSHLIAENQSSFVPAPHISDNIVIVQEVIHPITLKQGKKGVMAIKIDLDAMEFIRDSLEEVGLPASLIDLTMFCITSSSMQTFWNGEMAAALTPSRGIRQGNPISPYIFVLCIERLAHAINKEVNHGTWKAVQLSRGFQNYPICFFSCR